MPANIVTPLELFLLTLSLGLFVMAALTITRRRQAPQSRLLALAMCAEGFYCLGYPGDASKALEVQTNQARVARDRVHRISRVQIFE